MEQRLALQSDPGRRVACGNMGVEHAIGVSGVHIGDQLARLRITDLSPEQLPVKGAADLQVQPATFHIFPRDLLALAAQVHFGWLAVQRRQVMAV